MLDRFLILNKVIPDLVLEHLDDAAATTVVDDEKDQLTRRLFVKVQTVQGTIRARREAFDLYGFVVSRLFFCICICMNKSKNWSARLTARVRKSTKHLHNKTQSER